MKRRRRHASVRTQVRERLLRTARGLVWLTKAGLLVAALGSVLAGSHWFFAGDGMPIRRIELTTPVQVIESEEIVGLLQPYVGANFFTVNITQVRARLEEYPWIASAEIKRRWPETLQVAVRERQPVARWGDSELVDARGVRFAADRHVPEGLPILRAPSGREMQVLARFAAVQRQLPSAGLSLQELVEDERGAWRLTTLNGFEVRLGRSAFDERLDRFVVAFPNVLQPRVHDIEVVDLRYSNGFAVRWKPSGGEQAGRSIEGQRVNAEKG